MRFTFNHRTSMILLWCFCAQSNNCSIWQVTWCGSCNSSKCWWSMDSYRWCNNYYALDTWPNIHIANHDGIVFLITSLCCKMYSYLAVIHKQLILMLFLLLQSLFVPSVVSLAVPLALMSFSRYLRKQINVVLLGYWYLKKVHHLLHKMKYIFKLGCNLEISIFFFWKDCNLIYGFTSLPVPITEN